MTLRPVRLPAVVRGLLGCGQLDPKKQSRVSEKRNISKSIKTYSFVTSIRKIDFPQSLDYEKCKP